MLASERLLEIEEKFEAIHGDSFGRGYESHSKKDLAADLHR